MSQPSETHALPEGALAQALPAWRRRLLAFVDGGFFQGVVITIISLNAILLGVETFPIGKRFEALLMVIDRACVFFFILELSLRITAYGRAFFRSPWNVFDFFIVAVSSFPQATGVAALRALRILRVLRVVTVVPRMRTVVRGLFDAVPGIMSVAIVAMLVTYIFAVLASAWYGETNPDLFGDVFISMYTLFQIITLEGWRDIADAVGVYHPNSWIFFVVFVLVGTFTMLNLFIAIVVRVVEEEADETEEVVRHETQLMLDELARLSGKVEELSQRLNQQDGAEPPVR